MSHTILFPFSPPWEDLGQTVKTPNAPCYFFHTDCRGLSEEEKRRADEGMVKAYQESRRMQRLADMEKTDEPAGTQEEPAHSKGGTDRP